MDPLDAIPPVIAHALTESRSVETPAGLIKVPLVVANTVIGGTNPVVACAAWAMMFQDFPGPMIGVAALDVLVGEIHSREAAASLN